MPCSLSSMAADRPAELHSVAAEFPLMRVCGVDEAGRGPLAGAVYAAAVILDPDHPIPGLRDSKKLSERNRIGLAEEIRLHAVSWSVACASVEEIEQLNILHASMLAMQRAVQGLHPGAEMALIDGNRCPRLEIPSRAIVKKATTANRVYPRHRSWPRRKEIKKCGGLPISIQCMVSNVIPVTLPPRIWPRWRCMAQARYIGNCSGRYNEF